MAESDPLGDPVPNGPMRPVTKTVLEGIDVAIVPVDPTHATELYSGSHGSPAADRIWTYMGYGPFTDVKEMEGWIAGLAGSADPLFFTARDTRTEIPVGMASYLNIDQPMRRLEIGHIWYTVAAQRTTTNTEAAYLLARHAFNALGARRLEWKCDSLNQRSRVAALRLGFRFEGVLRNHMVVKGHNRDTAYFAMTDVDWVRARPVLERWLYDTDRDASGRPVVSLAEEMRTVNREG